MIIQPADRLSLFTEYYFSRKLREIATMREEGKDVINLGIGSPDMAPDKRVVDALASSAGVSSHHGYQSYNGTPELRGAIARWLKEYYRINVNPVDEVLPLLGSKEGILHISMAFLNPGDKVLVPEVGYPAYSALTKMVGAEVILYPLTDQWYPDWKAMNKMDLTGVKLMWMNYPHMPSGTPATVGLFEEAVAFAKEKGLLLCHDNPYSLVLNDNPMSIFSVEGSREVCLELNSLSKSHNMAGWRVGWIAGMAPYIAAVLKIKSNIDSGMFRAVQDAAVTALEDTREWHKQRDTVYRSRQVLAFQLLDQLGCGYNKQQAGLFVWGRIPEKVKSAEALADKILEEKFVFITPGTIFGAKGNRYVRVSLCMPESRIKEALDRLKE